MISISVRNLVEFILRSGDIDNRRKGGSNDPAVLLEGANIHRMIQRKMGSEYHAEVFMSDITHTDEYDIKVEGRADGIIIPHEWEEFVTQSDDSDAPGVELNSLLCRNTSVVVDEIKSTYRELEHIREADPVHLAQAKCYAYMFATQNHLPRISVRMTYVNIESLEVRYFNEDYSLEEITKWYGELIKEYKRWADFEFHWKQTRNFSIESMTFPYEFRTGQKELIAQVYRSIVAKEKLFVMAPTGVGKTLASVYPALKAMGEGRAEKIFYLTAKTITGTVASDCLTLLRGRALRLKSVAITAKEKICPLEECACNPEGCEYAKGHCDRINDAIYDMITHEDDWTRECIEEYSARHKVCPFEFSLDLSLFADVIICDYNYVFDPNVYLRRFFSDGVLKDYFFLVDEAHNLTDRAMKMYSAELIKDDFLEVRRLVKERSPKLARALESCNKHLLELKRECETVCVYDHFDTFIMLLTRLSGRIEEFMDDYPGLPEMNQVLEFYFRVRHFLNMYDNMHEDDYVLYTQCFYDGRFMIKLLCANPAKSIARCTDRAQFTVFFSATLLPLGYYRKLLGGTDADPAVYAKSIFDPKKRGLFIATDVTSKYTRRNDNEYEKMAEYIANTVLVRGGNYMVFCPSHALLNEVSDAYMRLYYDENTQEILLQTPSMNEPEREEFLERFAKGSDKQILVGFCVLGGIFSEGIDLKNDALVGAIIIGTGLPMVCEERELLKNRYTEAGLDGFAYAYRYPGMNKALQAAGRVIRTTEDTGVVVLLDERYLTRDYTPLFPREWDNYEICNLNNYAGKLAEFWARV